MKRRKYLVIESHMASFNYAMVAAEGEEVSIGREDPEMPGWFWSKNVMGIEMWVPKTYLKIRGGKGVFTQDYNSTEITASVGEHVQYLGETLGWIECLDRKWRYGWIPSVKLTRA